VGLARCQNRLTGLFHFLAGSKSPTRQPPAPKRFGGGASLRYGDGA
jgi:hypothetical protein